MEEKALTAKKSGFSMLLLCFIVFASGAALFVYAIGHLERGENALGCFLLVVAILGYIAGIIALPGFKVLKPQEALLLSGGQDARLTEFLLCRLPKSSRLFCFHSTIFRHNSPLRFAVFECCLQKSCF